MSLVARRSSLVARRSSLVAVAACMIGAVAVAPPAHASGWATPSTSWTTDRTTVVVSGRAYAHDFGCGLKDCATASHLFFRAQKLSGTGKPNEARVSAIVGFGGVGIEVGVSIPAGVSAGFTDGGSTCEAGFWSAPGSAVTVGFGSDTICEASSWGWVSNMTLSTAGGLRFGPNWRIRSASANVSLGGL